jgi:hypothetical protein
VGYSQAVAVVVAEPLMALQAVVQVAVVLVEQAQRLQ